MKYNLHRAMQKPKIQIHISKESLFTLALIKMKQKCLRQKIVSMFLQENVNRWNDTNQLRAAIFSFTHPEMRGVQRTGVSALEGNAILHISGRHKH